MKRLATAAALGALLATLPLNTASAGTAASEPCWDGSLKAASHSGLVPVVHHHGQKVDIFTPVRNSSSAVRPAAHLFVDIDAKGMRRNVPPTIWWRVDHSRWRLMHFNWVPGGRMYDPTWQTAELPMGGFAPHQTRTIELSISFPYSATWGWYNGYQSIGSAYCQANGHWEQGFSAFSVVNQPNGRT